MDGDSVEKYAAVLKTLHAVPDWYTSKLFGHDLSIELGWQVGCVLNTAKNRIVYSFYDGKRKGDTSRTLENFQRIHVDLFGCELHKFDEDPLGYDIYPTKMGYLDDLKPMTIATMIQKTIVQKPHIEDSFLTYLLEMSESMKEWAEHFKKLSDRLYVIKEDVDEIYDESL